MDKLKKILFVCTGNTCRSSMAEALLKDLLNKDGIGHIQVSSAGTNVFAPSAASQYAIEVMAEKGIDLSRHCSRQLTEDMLLEADLILTMTEGHRQRILHINPELADKVFTLKEFAYGPGYLEHLDISDPFGLPKEFYKQCSEEILQALQVVIEKIQKGEI